ncbi:MAG: helix-turn-helix domain-containing protein, partial [Cyanobacteria bacterium J06629_18]
AEDRTIKTHITNLRRKLKDAGMSEDFLETVYGIGYRLHCRS